MLTSSVITSYTIHPAEVFFIRYSITTSVVRGSHQGESHGGVYLVDFTGQAIEQVIDWNTADIDWQGRGWDEAVALKTAEFPDHARLIQMIRDNWHDAVPGEIPEGLQALRSVRDSGRPVYGITNFSAEKWAECQNRFDFLTHFTGVVVSAHERLIKPDPAIFRLFLDRNGLAAEDCLFIDDSAANIATADALGFDTIHLKDPACLMGKLRVRGVMQ